MDHGAAKRRVPGTAGVLTSMLLATVTTVSWESLGLSEDVNAVIVSLPVALVALVVVSLLTKQRAPTPGPVDPAPARG